MMMDGADETKELPMSDKANDLVEKLKSAIHALESYSPYGRCLLEIKAIHDAISFITESQGEREKVLWLVWSNEHRSWWRSNRAGYTNKLESAGRYPYAEAFGICRNGGVPRAGSDGDWPYEVMVPAPESQPPAGDLPTPTLDAFKTYAGDVLARHAEASPAGECEHVWIASSFWADEHCVNCPARRPLQPAEAPLVEETSLLKWLDLRYQETSAVSKRRMDLRDLAAFAIELDRRLSARK